MKEIEVKARIASVESFKEKLEQLGCRFDTPHIQHDIVFLPVGVEFSNKTKETPAVRIRNSNEIITLTLKKRSSGDNELINIEKEVVVSDKQEALDIVKHMGFHEVAKVSKRRFECTYENMTICIDDVVGLGQFIEVERLLENDSTHNDKEIQDELFDFLRSLEVNDDDRVTKGYDILMYEKSKSNQLLEI